MLGRTRHYPPRVRGGRAGLLCLSQGCLTDGRSDNLWHVCPGRGRNVEEGWGEGASRCGMTQRFGMLEEIPPCWKKTAEGWNVGYCSFLAAFLLRQHARTHTTTLAQNLLAFAWHHGMERTKRGWGRGRGDGVRGPRRFSWRQQCMHHSAARGIYHGWEYTTLLSEGEIQSFNHALNQDR